MTELTGLSGTDLAGTDKIVVVDDSGDAAVRKAADAAAGAVYASGLSALSGTARLPHTAVKGLGTAAAAATGDFATAAQGAKADTSVQPEDLGAAATSNSYGDLDDKPTLGTAAAAATGDFATAAQGAKADTSVQPEDLGAAATSNSYADLDDLPTLGTAAAAATGDFATAAQGAKADTSVQPGDLGAVATSNSYADLDDKPEVTGGDVVGPGVSTDGNLAVMDGATGKLIADGGVAVADVVTYSETVAVSNEWAELSATDGVVTLPSPSPFGEVRRWRTLAGDEGIASITPFLAGSVRLRVIQDATGGRVLSWPTDVRAIGFTDVTLPMTPNSFYDAIFTAGSDGVMEVHFGGKFDAAPLSIVGQTILVNNTPSTVENDKIMSVPAGLQDGDDLLLIQVKAFTTSATETPTVPASGNPTDMPADFTNVRDFTRISGGALEDRACMAVQRRTVTSVDLPLTEITLPKFLNQSSYSLMVVRGGIGSITSATAANRDGGADANEIALPVETISSGNALVLSVVWHSGKEKTYTVTGWDRQYTADHSGGDHVFATHAVFVQQNVTPGDTAAATVSLGGAAEESVSAMTMVLEPA